MVLAFIESNLNYPQVILDNPLIFRELWALLHYWLSGETKFACHSLAAKEKRTRQRSTESSPHSILTELTYCTSWILPGFFCVFIYILTLNISLMICEIWGLWVGTTSNRRFLLEHYIRIKYYLSVMGFNIVKNKLSTFLDKNNLAIFLLKIYSF